MEKFNNEELHEMGRKSNTHGEIKNPYCVSVGKHKGKRPPIRPRYRWENYIKTFLKEGGVVLSRPRPTLGCSTHDDDVNDDGS
jgi:hypothetical protein